MEGLMLMLGKSDGGIRVGLLTPYFLGMGFSFQSSKRFFSSKWSTQITELFVFSVTID